MKALLLKQRGGGLELTTLPDPRPGAGEAVIRVLAAPVLSYMRDVLDGTRDYPLVLPLVPGPGPVGVVEAVGPDATRLRPGQLVFCDPTIRARDDAIAPDIMLHGLIAAGPGAQILQGYFRHGAFAEKMLAPLENVAALEGFPESEAARLSWINTLLVPYGGLLAAELKAGDTVIINGASGHFGSAAAAIAVAMGAARVVATGRRREALEDLTSRLGHRLRPAVLTGNEADDIALVRQAAGGAGADCMLDMLNPIQTFAPTRTALMALRPFGRAALMGGVQADIALPYSHVMRNSLTLRGQFMYPRDAAPRLVALIRSGLLNLEGFHTTSFPLDQAEKALAHAAEHTGAFRQTVLTPFQGPAAG